MGRLVWTETRDGWSSGRYRIELAAPQLWVLSLLPKHVDAAPINACRVLRTGGSLRELKRLAGEMEWRADRRRRMATHLVVTALLVGIAVLSGALGWALVFPVAVAAFAVALRTLVMWVEGVTGSAWAVLSDHYQ